jgi:hypothetical protein
MELENEYTLASLGSEFLVAAQTLVETPSSRGNNATVIYYLLGHAAELLLKSFLFQMGVKMGDLKDAFGHKLGTLIKEGQKRGLPISNSLTGRIKGARVSYPGFR